MHAIPRSRRRPLTLVAILAVVLAGAALPGAPSAALGQAPQSDPLVVLGYGPPTGRPPGFEHLAHNPFLDRVVRISDDSVVSLVHPESLGETAMASSSALGSSDHRKLAVDPTRGWSYHNSRRSNDQLHLHVPQPNGSLVRHRLGSGQIGLPLPAANTWMLAVDPGSGVLHMSNGTNMRQVEPIDPANPQLASSWAVRTVTGAPAMIDFAFVAPGVAVGSLLNPIAGSRFAIVTITGTTAAVTPIPGVDGPAGTGLTARYNASYVAATPDGHVWLVGGQTARRFRIQGTTAIPVDGPVTLRFGVYASAELAADPVTGSLWVGHSDRNQVQVDEYRGGARVGSLAIDQHGSGFVSTAIDGRGGVVVLAQDHLYRVGRGAPATPPQAPPRPIVLNTGHFDVSPTLLPNGTAEFLIHDDTRTYQGRREHWWRAGDTVLHLKSTPANTYAAAPAAYVPWLGAGPVTYISEQQISGVIWAGWSRTHMGSFVQADYPEIRLVEVDGPGEFVMGPANNPELASRDLTRVYRPGSHTHQFWGFSAPGVYRLKLSIRAVTNEGGLVENVDTLTFVVGNDIDPATVLAPPLSFDEIDEHYHQGETIDLRLTADPPVAAGDRVDWEWQWPGGEWAPFPGASGLAHSIVAEQALDGVRVRATLTRAAGGAPIVADAVTIGVDDHGAPAAQQVTVGGGTSYRAGDTAALTAQVAPATLLDRYQWFEDGEPIAGATGASYSFTATAADHGRRYSVAVVKPDGQAAYGPSAPVTLAVAASVEHAVGGTVTPTLALTLGAPASFDEIAPGIARLYTASTTATVISTAGDAALTVSDPSADHPGHLVNGAFALAQPLQGLGTVKTYDGPVSNDVVTVDFAQAVGATDPLRTGSYSKTLAFTLSTTNP